MYLHSKNRSVVFQKHRKMFCFHHFQVFTRCCFQNVQVIVPCSKSTVFKICRQKCAIFVRTGGLSVTFFTVFKMCRHRMNAVLKHIWPTVHCSSHAMLQIIFERPFLLSLSSVSLLNSTKFSVKHSFYQETQREVIKVLPSLVGCVFNGKIFYRKCSDACSKLRKILKIIFL